MSEGSTSLPDLWSGTPHGRDARRASDARRYATLLVSDIRLYHEEEVILGRALSDIHERLGEAISSARAVYLRRFDDERIFESAVSRILAGRDPRKLG